MIFTTTLEGDPTVTAGVEEPITITKSSGHSKTSSSSMVTLKHSVTEAFTGGTKVTFSEEESKSVPSSVKHKQITHNNVKLV